MSQHSALLGGIRFAPSPTGRFHLGNLRTAWVSYEFARRLNAPWVVRFEDIDRPRVIAGAQEQQLADMAAFGWVPDRIQVQSDFAHRHWQLFREAIETGIVYPCNCSRKEVQAALAGLASAPHDGLAPVYTGACRELGARELAVAAKKGDSIAWRFRMPRDDGRDDFIIARSAAELDEHGVPALDSFVPGYHWACAIDDYDGQFELLVRSIDLAPALPLQRAIQSWMAEHEKFEEYFAPVFHTSLITQNDGHRLEKRTPGVTLTELQTESWSTNKLIAAFEKSFDSSQFNFDRGALEMAEARATLPLAKLLS